MASAIAASPASRALGNEAVGRRRMFFGTITMDTSYTTGGLAADVSGPAGFTPTQVIIAPRFVAGATGPLTRIFVYDLANKKVFAWVASTGVEVANAVDLSGVVLDFIAIGD